MDSLMISNSDNILIIAPHPDDESIGCGGLLLKYHSQCSVLVLTDGRYGGIKDDYLDIISCRKSESMMAMTYAGVKNIDFLDIEDTKLSLNSNVLRKYDFSRYTKIFCPNERENHIDHACVLGLLYKFGVKAEIFTYEVWTPVQDPTHYLDISNICDEKKFLINYYKTQVSQLAYDEKILGLNNYRGIQVYPSIKYAEVYEKK